METCLNLIYAVSNILILCRLEIIRDAPFHISHNPRRAKKVNTSPPMDIKTCSPGHPPCTRRLKPRIALFCPAVSPRISIPDTAHHILHLPATVDTPPPPRIKRSQSSPTVGSIVSRVTIGRWETPIPRTRQWLGTLWRPPFPPEILIPRCLLSTRKCMPQPFLMPTP